jgi:hypothetical protein
MSKTSDGIETLLGETTPVARVTGPNELVFDDLTITSRYFLGNEAYMATLTNVHSTNGALVADLQIAAYDHPFHLGPEDVDPEKLTWESDVKMVPFYVDGQVPKISSEGKSLSYAMVREVCPEGISDSTLNSLLTPLRNSLLDTATTCGVVSLPVVEADVTHSMAELLEGAEYHPTDRLQVTNMRIEPGFTGLEVVGDCAVGYVRGETAPMNNYRGARFGDLLTDARVAIFKEQVESGNLPVVEARK